MDYRATSVANTAGEDAAEGPLPQTVAGAIEKLLARGSERGYVTDDELSATLPLDQLSSEEIEDTMTMLSELGITVTESDESEEPVAPEGQPAKARDNLDHDDIGRSFAIVPTQPNELCAELHTRIRALRDPIVGRMIKLS